MDTLFQLRLLAFAGLIAFWAVILGAAMALQALLRFHETRGAFLRGRVRDQLAGFKSADRIGVSVGWSLLGWRRVVTLDMRDAAPVEIWPAVARLAPRLPHRVELVVVGTIAGAGTVALRPAAAA